MSFPSNIENHFASRRKNSRGFASLASLTLIPIVLTFFIGFAGLIHLLNRDTQMDLKCLNILYSVQYKNSILLDRLLKLNPQAERLRFSRSIAEKALAAAVASGNVFAIRIAVKRLQIIISKQQLLNTKQKGILLGTEQNRKLTLSLASANPKFRHINVPKLAVSPDNPLDLAPVYLKNQEFFHDQTARIKYSIPIFTMDFIKFVLWLDSNMNPMTEMALAEVNRQCEVSIETRGKVHRPRGLI